MPQLFWLALTFGLLYVLLKRFALPRVGEVIEERRERIERDLEKAEKLKAETQLALSNYELALAEARTKAGVIAKGDARRTGGGSREREGPGGRPDCARSSRKRKGASHRARPGRWPAWARSLRTRRGPSSPG